MTSKRPANWVVVPFLGIVLLLVLVLTGQLSWVRTLGVIAAQLAASWICLRRAGRARPSQLLWRMLATSILIASAAADLLLWSRLRGSRVHDSLPGVILVLNTLFGAALLLTVSLQPDRRVLRPLREMSAFLSAAIGVFCFVLVFSLVTIGGDNPPANLLMVARLYSVVSLYTALVATLRTVGADEGEERSFFYVASVFLWVNTIISAIRNQVQLVGGHDWPELLLTVPYIALIAAACSPLPGAVERWRPSTRLSSILRSGGTALLSLGLLMLGTAVSRVHFWIGASAALLSVVSYSWLNLLLFSRGVETEEALLRTKQKLEELAGLDGLTGIANRRTLDQRLDLEFQAARRSGRPISLLMIDVDLFKSLNDSRGHLVGDTYLVKVADALRSALARTNDLVARYGGEEFMILLPATGDTGAITVAGRLHAAIARLDLEHPGSPSGRLTVSIGCTTAESFLVQPSPMTLVRAADRALYMAKMRGRNRTEYLPFLSGTIDADAPGLPGEQPPRREAAPPGSPSFL